jgi:pimeloyl-ACP methyl ester carboxylesterase
VTINASLPRLDWVTIKRGKFQHRLPFLYRQGTTGPALFFIHGLGGAKENFYAAFQSPRLAHCHLLAFDFPGTGPAEFDPESCTDVSSLAEIAYLVWNTLLPQPAFIVAASMGGLVALLLIRQYGAAKVRGLINIEGNLAPEDCMFSRRVVEHRSMSFLRRFSTKCK